MRIGLIGSNYYNNGRKIKDVIYQLKQRFGEELVIISSGSGAGADKFIRKYALVLGCKYIEHNPSHTQKNLYSAMNEHFYNKDYAPKNFFHRNKMLAKDINCLIAFIPSNVKANGPMDTIKHTKKLGKSVVIIN